MVDFLSHFHGQLTLISLCAKTSHVLRQILSTATFWPPKPGQLSLVVTITDCLFHLHARGSCPRLTSPSGWKLSSLCPVGAF